MFISPYLLSSLVMSCGGLSMTTTNVSLSNSQLVTSSQTVTIVSDYDFVEDDYQDYTITFNGESYQFARVQFTDFGTYYNFDINYYFESNLVIQLIIRPADLDRDENRFSFVVYNDDYGEPYTIHKYSGEGVNHYNFNGFYDTEIYGSTLSSMSGCNIGFYIYALDESTYNSLIPEYSENYNNGFNDGYSQGYDTGSTEGYNTGYNVGYNEGNSTGFNNGYATGYSEGLNTDQTVTSIFSGILQVALVPINFFLAIFNFEILGINLSGFIKALFTIALTIIIIRTIFGGKGASDS